MTVSDCKLTNDLRGTFLAALYVLSAIGGSFQAVSQNALVFFVSALLFASLVTAWCAEDAQIRGWPLLPVLQMTMFFVWPVAVPIYLVASREWRGIAFALLHAVGLYSVTLACFLATAYLSN